MELNKVMLKTNLLHTNPGEHTMEHTKTQTTHTPGPWSVGRTLLTPETRKWSKEQIEKNDSIEEQFIFANFHAEDQGKGRICIASCHGFRGNNKANAKLISCAPELLEALKGLVSRATASEERTTVFKRAKAAITKATS